MKVLVNALGATMGGALRHLTNFIPRLAAIDNNNEYTFLVRAGMHLPNGCSNVHFVRRDNGATGALGRAMHDLLLLPYQLRRKPYDVLVSLTNFGPVKCPIPHVLFQRNSVYFSDAYQRWVPRSRRVHIALRRHWAYEAMKRAVTIVTPSNAMMNVICTAYPTLTGKRFHTLYHALDAKSLAVEPLQPSVRHLMRFAGLKLLYPSHPAPHKGFEVLFDALAILKQRGREFVLYTTIAREDWPEVVIPYERRVRHLGLERNVVFLGRVAQSQIGELYRTCDLMVYPSLLESFGFPMLEAIGFGLPIVAADTEVNREVCGRAALYYSKYDAGAAADVIDDACQPAVSQRLRVASECRLREYDWSWTRYAREFVGIISNAAAIA